MSLVQNLSSWAFRTAHTCIFVRLKEEFFIRCWDPAKSHWAKSHLHVGKVILPLTWQSAPFLSLSGLLMLKRWCFFIHFLYVRNKHTVTRKEQFPLLLSLQKKSRLPCQLIVILSVCQETYTGIVLDFQVSTLNLNSSSPDYVWWLIISEKRTMISAICPPKILIPVSSLMIRAVFSHLLPPFSCRSGHTEGM